MEKDSLIIPHPRMHKRGFVLRPICDIEPCFIHPVLKQDMKTLLSLVENDPSQEVSCCE
jgi:7,8-dihydro-6-hydroxymethylpterin-pyrophosphokinase